MINARNERKMPKLFPKTNQKKNELARIFHDNLPSCKICQDNLLFYKYSSCPARS